MKKFVHLITVSSLIGNVSYTSSSQPTPEQMNKAEQALSISKTEKQPNLSKQQMPAQQQSLLKQSATYAAALLALIATGAVTYFSLQNPRLNVPKSARGPVKRAPSPKTPSPELIKTAFEVAADGFDFDLQNLVLNYGLDLNVRDENKNTLLIVAAQHSQD